MRRGAAGRPLLGLYIPAAVAVLFILVPLVGLLTHASWADIGDALTSSAALTALRLSLECSLLAVIVSAIVGVPLAYLLARTTCAAAASCAGWCCCPWCCPRWWVASRCSPRSAGARRSGRAPQPVRGDPALQHRRGGDGGGLRGPAVPGDHGGGRPAPARRRLRGGGGDAGCASLASLLADHHAPVAPSLTAGAALCWARALGEFGATITFAGSFPGTTETLPLAAYSAFEGSGAVSRAITLSLILLVISVAVLVGLRDRWLGAVA